MRWLVDERGLDPEILKLNRVGADPGPSVLRRPAGIPRGGVVAAVFPALDPSGAVTYMQARYLDPGDRSKYDNPASRLGDNPRVAHVRPKVLLNNDILMICEGLPDAYTAAGRGLPAIAVLGAGYPDQRVANAITQTLGHRQPIIAFDNDPAGRTGANHLDYYSL